MNKESEKILLFVPTYNESQNVLPLIAQLRALPRPLDLLFLDDNSPDGTGKLLDEAAKTDKNLHIIHRSGRLGIGSAHKMGIAWAYEHGYKTLVTMDADFTHPPAKVLELVSVSEGLSGDVDVVLGSRYLQKNSLAGWNLLRKSLTWTAHILTTVLLGLKYDSTGAFRVYRLDRIPQSFFSLVESDGYSFFFESLHVLNINHFTIREVPIALPPRTYGSSKMSYIEALKSVRMLMLIYFKGLFTKRLAKGERLGQKSS